MSTADRCNACGFVPPDPVAANERTAILASAHDAVHAAHEEIRRLRKSLVMARSELAAILLVAPDFDGEDADDYGVAAREYSGCFDGAQRIARRAIRDADKGLGPDVGGCAVSGYVPVIDVPMAVHDLYMAGYSAQEIAKRLVVSLRSVDFILEDGTHGRR